MGAFSNATVNSRDWRLGNLSGQQHLPGFRRHNHLRLAAVRIEADDAFRSLADPNAVLAPAQTVRRIGLTDENGRRADRDTSDRPRGIKRNRSPIWRKHRIRRTERRFSAGDAPSIVFVQRSKVQLTVGRENDRGAIRRCSYQVSEGITEFISFSYAPSRVPEFSDIVQSVICKSGSLPIYQCRASARPSRALSS